MAQCANSSRKTNAYPGALKILVIIWGSVRPMLKSRDKSSNVAECPSVKASEDSRMMTDEMSESIGNLKVRCRNPKAV
jgi:hypothetical protein